MKRRHINTTLLFCVIFAALGCQQGNESPQNQTTPQTMSSPSPQNYSPPLNTTVNPTRPAYVPSENVPDYQPQSQTRQSDIMIIDSSNGPQLHGIMESNGNHVIIDTPRGPALGNSLPDGNIILDTPDGLKLLHKMP